MFKCAHDIDVSHPDFLYPIFHWILGLHWPPNVPEIDSTYIPLTCVWLSRRGVTPILGLVSGVKQIFAFLDTNMLVSPRRNCGVGGISQRQDLT